MQRRDILKLVGGGVIVSAASLAGFASTRSPTKALRPWGQAGQYEEVRRFALSYAILAPNPHNRQPWMAELVGEHEIHIYRDLDKNLPETDPFDRQLTIGMGCFLEALTVAAAQKNYRAETQLFPTQNEDYVARITLKAEAGLAGTDGELFGAFQDRRSCKEPFSDTELEPAHAQALSVFGDVYTNARAVDRLKTISWDAFLVEYETERTLKESVDLMRIGKSQINATPDGIDLGGPLLEMLSLIGNLTPETLMDPQSAAYQQGRDMYEKMLKSTPAYILLKTQGNTRADQIAAGRQWLRLNLMTTYLGVSLHPISQALQEYSEMKPLNQAIQTSFARDGDTIQMFGRLGYGPKTPPAPRWGVEAKLI